MQIVKNKEMPFPNGTFQIFEDNTLMPPSPSFFSFQVCPPVSSAGLSRDFVSDVDAMPADFPWMYSQGSRHFLKCCHFVLASVPLWAGVLSRNRNVTGLIPVQGTSLSGGFGPRSERL